MAIVRCTRRVLVACALTALTGGCGFEWDELDPRVGGGTGGRSVGASSGGGGPGVGGDEAASGSGAGPSVGTATGGADPCGGMCASGEQCVDETCVGPIELVTNGDFSNDLGGWTDDNNPVNDNDTTITFEVTGGVCENGASAGPSARVLYQDVAIPAMVVDATFSLSFAQDNTDPLDPQNVTVIEKDPLDESMNGLEENAFRIDLVDARGSVFYAAIERELFAPAMSMGSESQLVSIADPVPGLVATLQAHAGGTLRLRIAQVESTFPWRVYLDDVSLSVIGAP